MGKKLQSLTQGDAVSWTVKATYDGECPNTGRQMFKIFGSDKSVGLNEKAVEEALDIAPYYTKTEFVTKTEIQNLIRDNSRTAITVGFFKKDEKRTHLKQAKEANVQPLLNHAYTIEDLIDDTPPSKRAKVLAKWVEDLKQEAMRINDNPVTSTISGEFRIMQGYHESQFHENGDVKFFDQQQDTRPRHLNLGRTIMVTVGGVRLSLIHI